MDSQIWFISNTQFWRNSIYELSIKEGREGVDKELPQVMGFSQNFSDLRNKGGGEQHKSDNKTGYGGHIVQTRLYWGVESEKSARKKWPKMTGGAGHSLAPQQTCAEI